MSGKASGAVWDMDLPKEEKYILLAYADKADHEGYGVFPSYGLVAWMTGYTKRYVMKVVQRLEDKKIMVLDKAGGMGKEGTSNRPNEWHIDFEAAPRKKARRRGGVSQDTRVVSPSSPGVVSPSSPDPSIDPSGKPIGPAVPAQRDLAFEWVVTEVLHGAVEAVKVDRNLQGLANRMLSSLVAQEKMRRRLKAAQPLSKDARAELAARLPGLKHFWLDAHTGLSERDFPSTPPAFSKVVAQWYAAGCPQGAVAQPLDPVLTYDPNCPLHCDHGLTILPDGRAVDCACRTRILAQYGVKS